MKLGNFSFLKFVFFPLHISREELAKKNFIGQNQYHLMYWKRGENKKNEKYIRINTTTKQRFKI